jgi:glycosyltransferase involved in cell wall biosynthesis
MSVPIVSVLMTAFNREVFISEAIESVLSSTFNDFELIIVDDCSMDRTLEIARKFEKKDSRIKVFANEYNLGDYPNRNQAALYAKGRYLKYLDSDDRMAMNCLDRLVSEMEKHENCAFGISSRVNNSVLIHTPSRAFYTHFFERGILDLSPSSSIIRRDIFLLEGGFLKTRCVSDIEFWMRLALKYPFLEMEADLVFWRQHEQQEINLGKDEYIVHYLNILKEKLFQTTLTGVIQKQILNSVTKSTSRNIIKNFPKRGLKKSIELWKLNNLKIFDVF